MKILFVIDTYNTNNNGTSISAQRYAAELREMGHEVRILCSDADEAPDKYVVKELVVPGFDGLIKKHGFQFAQFSRKIIKEALEWCDIAHCFMPFALEAMTKVEADSMHKPCTAAFHIQPENMTSSVHLGKVQWVNNLFYDNFNFFVYRHFDHIHVPSQFMADEIIKRGYKAKIYVISNGIQPDFKYNKREKDPQYAGKRLVMMVGRLSKEKRQDVIIDAVAMSKYADSIQLVFAGKGPMYEDYVKMGEKLANKPKFVYLTKPELIDLLSQCDLYVHASDMESEAISCIEAFATGLVPVIANSELSATPQFALDGRSLFMPGSPKDLARAMDYWFDNEDEKKAMELKYAEHAQKYNIKGCVRQFEQMLKDAITDYKG